MGNIFLKCLDTECMVPSAKPICHDTICFLKSEVRKIIGIKENRSVLINAMDTGHGSKTIVMIECPNSEKMKIYSIDKHPSDIQEEDLLSLEYRHYKPALQTLALKT